MKRFLNCHSLVRLISVLLPLSLILEHVLMAPETSLWYLCACIVSGNCVCLMSPLSYEDPRPSLDAAFSAAALLTLAGWLVCTLPAGPEIMLCTSFLLLFAYIRWRSARKYLNVRSLFRADCVWCSVEDSARDSYTNALCILSLMLMLAHILEAGPVWSALLLSLAGIAFVLCYARAWSGRTGLIPRDKENTIKEIIRGNLRGALPDVEIDEHMTAVYSKVTAFMDEKRPYLDEKFNMDDLSGAVFSNRAYLSKAINCFSGRNFRQFVNYYRVNYSIELMKKDPHLKVLELAMMSGFHSVVTYNMAFKLFTGTTPSAYLDSIIRRQRRERLSRKKG